MDANAIIFIGWVCVGIVNIFAQELGKPCRWFTYWCTYIALINTLAQLAFS